MRPVLIARPTEYTRGGDLAQGKVLGQVFLDKGAGMGNYRRLGVRMLDHEPIAQKTEVLRKDVEQMNDGVVPPPRNHRRGKISRPHLVSGHEHSPAPGRAHQPVTQFPRRRASENLSGAQESNQCFTEE